MTKQMAEWILKGGWINAEFSEAAINEAKKVMAAYGKEVQGIAQTTHATAS